MVDLALFTPIRLAYSKIKLINTNYRTFATVIAKKQLNTYGKEQKSTHIKRAHHQRLGC